ncbi:hypothetical protein Cob_v013179 [Colletotrichum orbiculare MAFF 240422]|uniref:Uncharacterized protein n=1 Tax=Colletotrichum orbiculare (strain 104-T / ATCC 96160 / CBS 514.97 / LARS 414 / MAFF 240422) TaxID=1213857 RepID=A0A484F7G6_COLOR|nr:hypothetical protein Cob_v013179 [Colletotrichum orbiculare MAFF 240422]
MMTPASVTRSQGPNNVSKSMSDFQTNKTAYVVRAPACLTAEIRGNEQTKLVKKTGRRISTKHIVLDTDAIEYFRQICRLLALLLLLIEPVYVPLFATDIKTFRSTKFLVCVVSLLLDIIQSAPQHVSLRFNPPQDPAKCANLGHIQRRWSLFAPGSLVAEAVKHLQGLKHSLLPSSTGAIRTHAGPEAGSDTAAGQGKASEPGQGQANDQNGPGRNKRPFDDRGSEGGKTTATTKRAKRDEEDEDRKRFACPFCKLRPNDYRSCLTRGHLTPSHVKTHIYRAHSLGPHCPICWLRFKGRVECDAHIADMSCTRIDKPVGVALMVDEDKQNALRIRTRGDGGAETWYKIWRIVFPHDETPSSPYLEEEDFEHLALQITADRLRSTFRQQLASVEHVTDVATASILRALDAAISIVSLPNNSSEASRDNNHPPGGNAQRAMPHRDTRTRRNRQATPSASSPTSTVRGNTLRQQGLGAQRRLLQPAQPLLQSISESPVAGRVGPGPVAPNFGAIGPSTPQRSPTRGAMPPHPSFHQQQYGHLGFEMTPPPTQERSMQRSFINADMYSPTLNDELWGMEVSSDSFPPNNPNWSPSRDQLLEYGMAAPTNHGSLLNSSNESTFTGGGATRVEILESGSAAGQADNGNYL